MKAAICRQGEIVVDEISEPVPGPGQVLVKTLACGICGSDLHHLNLSRQVQKGYPTANGLASDPAEDLVLGHEFVGEVLSYGDGTKKTIKEGARVCSIPLIFAGQEIQPLGFSNLYPGGYGEKMLLSEALLVELPEGASTEHATLTEPLAVGLHAVEQAQWQGDEIAVVLGCGAIGLAVIAMLKQKGISPVIAADYSPRRRQLAAAMGADIVVDPLEQSPYEAWMKVAMPDGGDPNGFEYALGLKSLRGAVLFECVGAPGVIQQMIDGSPKKAQIVVVGVCDKQDHFEPAAAVRKELKLLFAYAYTPEEFSRALHLIADGAIDVNPMITGKVGLEGVAKAFRDLSNPEEHAKVLIEPWR